MEELYSEIFITTDEEATEGEESGRRILKPRPKKPAGGGSSTGGGGLYDVADPEGDLDTTRIVFLVTVFLNLILCIP